MARYKNSFNFISLLIIYLIYLIFVYIGVVTGDRECHVYKHH